MTEIKNKKQKQKQKAPKIKEYKINVNISENDLNTKIKQATKQLDKGYHVRFVLFAKGRQASLDDYNNEKMNNKLDEIIKDFKLINKHTKAGRYHAVVKKK